MALCKWFIDKDGGPVYASITDDKPAIALPIVIRNQCGWWHECEDRADQNWTCPIRDVKARSEHGG